jgi:hypothetical protein
MKDIHPEIKKFWENQGFEVREPWFSRSQYIYGYKNSFISKLIARTDLNDSYEYLFKNWKSEEEMLRLIKLKAFL